MYHNICWVYKHFPNVVFIMHKAHAYKNTWRGARESSYWHFVLEGHFILSSSGIRNRQIYTSDYWYSFIFCGRIINNVRFCKTHTHYNDVIMSAMASQITSLTTVYSTPRHWLLCGEFTDDRWIPRQRANNAENVSIWWRHLDMHPITLTHHDEIWSVIYEFSLIFLFTLLFLLYEKLRFSRLCFTKMQCSVFHLPCSVWDMSTTFWGYLVEANHINKCITMTS